MSFMYAESQPAQLDSDYNGFHFGFFFWATGTKSPFCAFLKDHEDYTVSTQEA